MRMTISGVEENVILLIWDISNPETLGKWFTVRQLPQKRDLSEEKIVLGVAERKEKTGSRKSHSGTSSKGRRVARDKSQKKFSHKIQIFKSLPSTPAFLTLIPTITNRQTL